MLDKLFDLISLVCSCLMIVAVFFSKPFGPQIPLPSRTGPVDWKPFGPQIPLSGRGPDNSGLAKSVATADPGPNFGTPEVI